MGAIWTPKKAKAAQPQGNRRLSDEYRDAEAVFLGSNPTHNAGRLFEKWNQQGSPSSALISSSLTRRSPSYSGNNRYTGPSKNPAALNWPGLTVVARFLCNSQDANEFPSIISWVPVGEFYGGFNLSTEVFNGWRNIFIRAGDSANPLNMISYGGGHSGAHQWSPGDLITVVATWDKSTLKIWSFDGSLYRGNQNSHSFGWRNSSSLFAALGYERSGFRTTPHDVEVAYVLPRAVPDASALNLLDNPYGIFGEPATRAIFLPAATTTITASGAGVRQLIGNQYMAVAASRLNGVLQ